MPEIFKLYICLQLANSATAFWLHAQTHGGMQTLKCRPRHSFYHRFYVYLCICIISNNVAWEKPSAKTSPVLGCLNFLFTHPIGPNWFLLAYPVSFWEAELAAFCLFWKERFQVPCFSQETILSPWTLQCNLQPHKVKKAKVNPKEY